MVSAQEAAAAATTWTAMEKMAVLAAMGARSQPLAITGRVKFSVKIGVLIIDRAPSFGRSRQKELAVIPRQRADEGRLQEEFREQQEQRKRR